MMNISSRDQDIACEGTVAAAAGVGASAHAKAGEVSTLVWQHFASSPDGSAQFIQRQIPLTREDHEPGWSREYHEPGGPGLEVLCTTVTTQVPVQVSLCIGGLQMYSRTLPKPGTYLLGGVPRVLTSRHKVSLETRGIGTQVEAKAAGENAGDGAEDDISAAQPAPGQVTATDIVVTSTYIKRNEICDDTVRPLIKYQHAITRPFVQRTARSFGAATEVCFPLMLHGLQLAVSRPGLAACSIYLRPHGDDAVRVLVGSHRADSGRVCFQLECALSARNDLDIVLDMGGHEDICAATEATAETTVELEAINFCVTLQGLSASLFH